MISRDQHHDLKQDRESASLRHVALPRGAVRSIYQDTVCSPMSRNALQPSTDQITYYFLVSLVRNTHTHIYLTSRHLPAAKSLENPGYLRAFAKNQSSNCNAGYISSLAISPLVIRSFMVQSEVSTASELSAPHCPTNSCFSTTPR
ncbi:hypothetical protein IQ06DRAFT_75778 [Phaeosphaeriaceae sp. SRC1lsM3a]|nr:hypothetical protein IQ06DRAFT_75778 [Stagonospora sp. SRC1lsM3a]